MEPISIVPVEVLSWNDPYGSSIGENDNGGLMMQDVWEYGYRLLQSNSSSGSNNSTSTETYNDAATLRNTLRLYGSIFVVLLTLFCFVRQRYPRVYNLRNWIDAIKIPLANDQFGFISWMYKLWLVSNYEMLDECGMDALCYTRVLEFGLKLSMVGMFVGVWLMPVYATSESSSETAGIDDPIVSMSTSNVPSGSSRFIATVLAAYIVFGYCMYNMLQEFEWFYLYRYEFLKKPTMPRNFSVYVQNIPDEYLSPGRLREYFTKFSSRMGGYKDASTLNVDDVDDSTSVGVLDACVSLKIPNLKKKVAELAAVLAKLEHAINVEDVTGTVPRRKKDNVKIVDALYGQLRDLNAQVAASIDHIGQLQFQLERDNNTTRRTEPYVAAAPGGNNHFVNEFHPLMTGSNDGTTMGLDCGVHTQDDSGGSGNGLDDYGGGTGSTVDSFTTNDTPLYAGTTISQQRLLFANTATSSSNSTNNNNDQNVVGMDPLSQPNNPERTPSSLALLSKNLAGGVVKVASTTAGGVVKVASTTAGSARALFTTEDGRPLTAGFVTFDNLQSVYAARQMRHYPQPFAMEVLEAPGVDDINWANVGKTHKQLQLGMLLSMSLTTLLCLFWTIPMSFISTLSSIEGLTGEFPFINDLLIAAPWLEPVLAQLAPLMIIVAGIVLRMILQALSSLEGPVSGAVVQASLFSKLAAFNIIQTFFVTAISGSLVSQLSAMFQNPEMIVDLLANTLPTQSTFYIQILIVQTSISLVMELLRVVALVHAGIRSCVGPRLTPEEQETTWMGIKPLADPGEFGHADMLSGLVLYFLVYFVYAALAPITSFFMFACFLFLGSGYRHQFIYIYPTKPDSGGKLWVKFMKLIPTLMIIAQVTILGFLGLKKSPVGVAMMVPLLIVTILFTIYVGQQHFPMTDYLPARECMEMDRQNRANRLDTSFLIGRYVQPELKEGDAFPQNASARRQLEHDMVNPGTAAALGIPTADRSV